jgi:hypothetical protein
VGFLPHGSFVLLSWFRHRRLPCIHQTLRWHHQPTAQLALC